MRGPQTRAHEVVSASGAYEFLLALERQTSITTFTDDQLLELMDAAGVLDGATLLTELLATGLLARRGDVSGLTTLGIRTTLLLQAINEGNISEVFDRLATYDPSLHRYELVREGMTHQFIDGLTRRPGFQRLYICSPWISFAAVDLGALMTAIIREERRGNTPELLVITRPAKGTKDTPPEAVVPLQELGGTVFLHPRLHTKLYIREPGNNGGEMMAIIGSQNLTQSNYLELGIRINSDTCLVGQLIRYYLDLTNTCIEA